MNIGFFTETYFPQMSGVATSIQTLKEELEHMGHHVYIFTSTDPNAEPDKEIDIIRLPSIPFFFYDDKRLVVSGVNDAYIEAKKYNLDIIHTHNEFGCGLLGKFVAKNLKIPVIHTYHTMYEDYVHYFMKGKVVKPQHVKHIAKWFINPLAGVIAPSHRVKDTLVDYGITPPIRVIPTGIKIDKYIRKDITKEDCNKLREKIGLSPDDIMLLQISRLGSEKNIQTILNGLPEIVNEIPNVKLVIVGDGPYRETLEEMVENLNLQNFVFFTGQIPQEETPYYYHAADYFVFASTTETQGLTYTEAMSSGLQAIVQGNDYVRDLFDHESLGVTYEGDEKFAETAIAYIQKNVPINQEILKQKLYEISSENFAQNVYAFYLDTLVSFTKASRERKKKGSMHLLKEKIIQHPMKVLKITKSTSDFFKK